MAGKLIYLIGKSGSGKTTISEELYGRIRLSSKNKVQLIDGDEIRNELGNLFGYTHEERMKNNQVVRCVLKYLLKNDISVILSQVCGFREMQKLMRETFEPDYIEVYVKCSTAECQRRDVKGYYKRNLADLNGISDVFIEPEKPEVVVDTQEHNVDECVYKILKYLEVNKIEL